ncbi:hypothetical protein WME99_28795 [Sorangium sp. So ce136]|uniref:hypothetical protein n=1 Tax=Sorangium sp. So ce136 TaxID=3133284 RepID=UPI003F0AD535
MGRLRFSSSLLIVAGAAVFSAGLAASCSATGKQGTFNLSGGGGDDTGAGEGGDGGQGGAGVAGEGGAAGGLDGLGGFINIDGGQEQPDDVTVNPCGSACGDKELCTGAYLGLDDDCDGRIDEECPCVPGQAHSCFRGDPSFRDSPGCFPGSQLCDETGTWGPCVGGVHADESCYVNSAVACHPLQSPPFADVDLKAGTGIFNADAVPGSERWTVACPEGIDPCPAVSGTDPADDFKPLQSGEYTVTYTKRLANGETGTCKYPLFVGAGGLRVELEWEHDFGRVDLDLHVHKPNNTQPWKTTGSPADCGWANCTIKQFEDVSEVRWFSDSATPPDPVNWFLDPVDSNNNCFFAPRGVGKAWRDNEMGCHNPRLDLDNVSCDASVTDPDDDEFCAPENINIDFPPKAQWIRIGVHYYGHGGVPDDIHPRVKIFCNSALGADLGPTGFYSPERAVAFAPADVRDRFWLVADVLFPEPDECGQETCVVQPLYRNGETKTPLLTTKDYVEANFGPAYPPLP